MKSNVLKKVICLSIIMLFATIFSPYYVYSKEKNIVDELILDLKNPDPEIRRNAVDVL